MPRYITLKDNKIVTVRIGAEIVPGEIQSDRGEIGQVYDGIADTFTTPAPPPPPEIDVAKAIQEIQNHYTASAALMDKIKTKLGIT